jgi:hypothetical protein
MQSRPNNQFQPYIESVENIVSAMKLKERYVEELNSSDFTDASQNIRNKLVTFEALFASAKEPNVPDQNALRLTDAQKQLFEKVIEDANLGIESHSLKVLRTSIKDLESFPKRIINT